MPSSGNAPSCQITKHQVTTSLFSLENKRVLNTGRQVGGGRPKTETGSRLGRGSSGLSQTTEKFWKAWGCLPKPQMYLACHILISSLWGFMLIECLHASRIDQVSCQRGQAKEASAAPTGAMGNHNGLPSNKLLLFSPHAKPTAVPCRVPHCEVI